MTASMMRSWIAWTTSPEQLGRVLSHEHMDDQAAALMLVAQTKGYSAALAVADALKGMRS